MSAANKEPEIFHGQEFTLSPTVDRQLHLSQIGMKPELTDQRLRHRLSVRRFWFLVP